MKLSFSSKKKRNLSIADLLPLSHIDDGFIVKQDGTLIDIIALTSKDLRNIKDDAYKRDVEAYEVLYNTLIGDCKILSLNFPTDTRQQEQYIKHKINLSKNPVFREELSKELLKVSNIGKVVTYREYYIMLFAKDKAQMDDYRKTIFATLGTGGLVEDISLDKKVSILFELCNKNTVLSKDEKFEILKFTAEDVERVSSEKKGNSDFLSTIQPQGGITFSEDYARVGDGYEACIHIYQYPNDLLDNWLTTVANIKDTVATIDISNADLNEVRKNVSRSMIELKSRTTSGNDPTAQMTAQEHLHQLAQFYRDTETNNKAVKLVVIRIFVAARTLAALENRAKEIITELNAQGYKNAIFLNEARYEWSSVVKSYTEQNQITVAKRKGQAMPSTALAEGYPTHFSALHDPRGMYLGFTPVGGAVFFDNFIVSRSRTSYNAAMFGNMGMGKSTTLKKMLKWAAITGNFIRLFDGTGEFQTLIEHLGGRVVALDGTDGVLNPLEIMGGGETPELTFAKHVSKFGTIYKCLDPAAGVHDIAAVEDLLLELYISFGIMPKDKAALAWTQISGLAPEKYPIFSDFLNLIDDKLNNIKEHGKTVQDALEVEKMKRVERIRTIIHSVVLNFGKIFNGHTSIPNLESVPIVSFNIRNLSGYKKTVFEAQMFNALALCWDNCLKIGVPMKEAFEKKTIPLEDITRFLIIIDEAHKIINTNKLTGVQQLVDYEREGRKYFGGLVFASQSVRDFVPAGAKAEAIEKIITLFELTVYKFIMQQDSNAIQTLNEVFNGVLTKQELDDIPRLGKGETILSISGDRNVMLKVDVSEAELELFKGGA